jgi:hypothetical protein
MKEFLINKTLRVASVQDIRGFVKETLNNKISHVCP